MSSKLTPRRKYFIKLIIVLVISLIAVLAFFSNLIGRSFNSDDVAEQSMAHNLLTSSHHSLQFQIDTYIIKYPAYWLIGAISHTSVTQIAIESILFNLIMIFLLWYWWKNFSSNNPLRWLVFAWLIACGTYWMAQTINPNTRNLELPIMLLVGCYVIKQIERLNKLGYKLNRRFISIAAALAIVTGVLIYDDPYLLFFILLPLFIATAIYAKIKKDVRPLLLVTFGLTVSLVVFKLFEVSATNFGINLSKFNELNDLGSSVTTTSFLPTKILDTLEGYLSLFGINTFSASLSFWRFLFGLSGLSIIVLAFIELSNIFRKRIYTLINLWIISVFFFTFLYVIIVGTPLYNTLRYLIILVPLTALLALNGLVILKKSNFKFYKVFVWAIVLSIVCNLIVAITNLKENNQNPRPDKINYGLVATLNKYGVGNAYGNYWTANISYYLSNYRDNVLPTVCYNGIIYKDSSLLDSNRFNFSSKKIGVIVTPNLIAPTNSPDPQSYSCTVSATIKQFGKPQKIVNVAPSVNLLIYNHSLSLPWRQF